MKMAFISHLPYSEVVPVLAAPTLSDLYERRSFLFGQELLTELQSSKGWKHRQADITGLCLGCTTESAASRLREVVFTNPSRGTCETAQVSSLHLPNTRRQQTGVESYQDRQGDFKKLL